MLSSSMLSTSFSQLLQLEHHTQNRRPDLEMLGSPRGITFTINSKILCFVRGNFIKRVTGALRLSKPPRNNHSGTTVFEEMLLVSILQ